MLRSLPFLGALSALLLIGAPNASAQQTHPVRAGSAATHKPAPHQPVSATGKRSSATTKASGATSTSAAAASGSSGSNDVTNNSDTPNTVNANGSIGSQETADGKGQGAYAAPGTPVNPEGGKKTDSYRGKAPKSKSSRGSSTLKPGGQ